MHSAAMMRLSDVIRSTLQGGDETVSGRIAQADIRFISAPDEIIARVESKIFTDIIPIDAHEPTDHGIEAQLLFNLKSCFLASKK